MAGYIGTRIPVVSPGTERKRVFNVTGSQSVFTGVLYTPGFVHVFKNGERLVEGTDYTGSDGTSITLTSPATGGDVVVVISNATFDIADVVPSTGGTFQGPVDFADSASFLDIDIADKITHAGDTNTSIRFPAADTVTVETAGSERVRVDSSGNVGIGTSSPVTILDVIGTSPILHRYTGSANAFLFGQYNPGGDANINNQANASLLLATNNAERMRLDTSGNLLVGTTSATPNPGAAIFPGGGMSLGNSAGSSGSEFITFRRSGVQIGSITQSGTTGVAYNNSSDYRLKEDVQPMVGASDRLMDLKPVNFAWKADGTRVDGFLAHEAQEVVPEAVTGSKDAVDKDGKPEYQGIDQSKLVPLLTAALQEALTKIETLEARVAALES